jgi:hypothetical protein
MLLKKPVLASINDLIVRRVAHRMADNIYRLDSHRRRYIMLATYSAIRNTRGNTNCLLDILCCQGEYFLELTDNAERGDHGVF